MEEKVEKVEKPLEVDEQLRIARSDYFIIPKGAKTVAELIEKDEAGKYYLELAEKKQISHDTIVLSFKFPCDDWILGNLVS